MKAIILFILGTFLVLGAIVTAESWFPYQLPAAYIGGGLIAGMSGRAYKKIIEWVDS